MKEEAHDNLKIEDREIALLKEVCYSQNARVIAEDRTMKANIHNSLKKQILSPQVQKTAFSDDPFFSGLNCYAQVC